MADQLLAQIDAFTRCYHEAKSLDNDYDKYNRYFSEMSLKFPRAISYKSIRCRLIVNPTTKLYGFPCYLRDRIRKQTGQDRRMVLHVGIFNRRDSLQGHSALLIFDTLRRIQYYYDPLAFLGDNSQASAYMANTSLIEGYKCKVLMAPFSHQSIQKLVEPPALHNTTCGLVCILVSLCFLYNTQDFAETIDVLTQTCISNSTYMQTFMLRFAAYYNKQVYGYYE